jgi:hypothetical protein
MVAGTNGFSCRRIGWCEILAPLFFAQAPFVAARQSHLILSAIAGSSCGRRRTGDHSAVVRGNVVSRLLPWTDWKKVPTLTALARSSTNSGHSARSASRCTTLAQSFASIIQDDRTMVRNEDDRRDAQRGAKPHPFDREKGAPAHQQYMASIPVIPEAARNDDELMMPA